MIEIPEENPELKWLAETDYKEPIMDVMPNMVHIGNKVLFFTHGLLNHVNMDDPLTELRVVRKEIVSNWKLKSKGFSIEVELNLLVEKSDYTIAEIPIEYKARLGEKKLNPRHVFTIFKRILTETI
jgi:dolichol-phosphate mannosyltransferase